MNGPERVRQLVHAALHAARESRAEQAEAVLLTHHEALTRFANNLIHQNVAEANATLTIRAVVGRRQGTATTNNLSDAGLAQAAEAACEAALRQPEDPDFKGLPGPHTLGEVRAFDEATAGFSPEERARAVGIVCRKAKEQGLNASGAFRTGVDELAVANSLEWPRFDLVGHDWGGAVAWMTAAAHPDRLRTLTSVSTPHGAAFAAALRDDPDQQKRSRYFQLFRIPDKAERELLEGGLMRRAFRGLPPDRAEHYIKRFSEPGALTAALNWYRAMRRPERQGPITTPTLFVWSTEDVAIGETAARATEQHVEGPYRFEVLSGVSHWISEEVPERLSALLLEHLAAF